MQRIYSKIPIQFDQSKTQSIWLHTFRLNTTTPQRRKKERRKITQKDCLPIFIKKTTLRVLPSTEYSLSPYFPILPSTSQPVEVGTGGSSKLPTRHLLRFWIAKNPFAISCAPNGWGAVLKVHLYSPFLVRVRALPQINSFPGVPFVCVCDTP